MTNTEEVPVLPTNFGWVGLGAMGYPMVGQLRRKLPKTCVLRVFDIDSETTTRFLEEETKFDAFRGFLGARVEIVNSSREIAEKSVSHSLPPCVSR